MPRRPARPCRALGCPALVDGGGYCPTHKRDEARRYDAERGTAHERGYTARWRRARARYLWEHPLCVECEREGRVEPARDVDHIIPVSGPNDPLFWDESNWQGLCHSHHSTKTAKQDGRWAGRGG